MEEGANEFVMETNSDSTSSSANLFNEDDISDDVDCFRFSDRVQTYLTRSNKNVISLFSEVYREVFKADPTYSTNVISGDSLNIFFFVTSVTVGSETVRGGARKTKKEAKESCVRPALQLLCDSFLQMFGNPSMHIALEKDNTLFELIRQHTYAKFYRLAATCPDMVGTEKVVSGMFLYNSTDSSLQIISLATGNKCLRGDYLSLSGRVVHDCHAEIITRRGLLRFFYAQLLVFTRTPEKSIFKRHDSGMLMIRSNLSFHLFINTAPCGDGRVYEMAGCLDNGNENAGRLRFKVESGMGTILGNDDSSVVCQTFDGVLGGERLKTMSCSDKILRWNALGLQGSLLSRILQPVYLSSITVSNLMDPMRLGRAVSGRLNGLLLQDPFRISVPILGSCQDQVCPRDVTRSAQAAVNWNLADDTVEIVSTSTGQVTYAETTTDGQTTTVSRLCKKSLVEMYKRVCIELGIPIPEGYTYEKLKLCCSDYNVAKRSLEAWFAANKLGKWRSKPEDVSTFFV